MVGPSLVAKAAQLNLPDRMGLNRDEAGILGVHMSIRWIDSLPLRLAAQHR